MKAKGKDSLLSAAAQNIHQPRWQSFCQRGWWFLQKWYTAFKALITFAEVISMGEQEHRKLNNALASTCMEGFQVTEQTEQDCIRLLRGEVFAADLVREILNRPAKAV